MKNLKPMMLKPTANPSLNNMVCKQLKMDFLLRRAFLSTKEKVLITSGAIMVVALFFASTLQAQNASPYWSIAGNNNATRTAKLGTTNLVPLVLFTGNSERMRIDSIGRVGIGNTKPMNILTVQTSGGTPASSWLNGLNSPVFMGFADNVSSEFVLAGASNTVTRRPVMQGRRSRGTLESPEAVLNNDYLSSILSSGYDGTTFQNPAAIDFFVDGTPTPGNVPARVSIVTGTNATNRFERLKVSSNGDISFNDNQLTVNKTSGYVGIGVAIPINKFQIGSAPGFSGNDIFIGNGTKGMSFFQSPIASIWYTSANFSLMPAGNGTGNVGIGTMNPINKLQIGTAPGFSGNDIFIGNGTKGMSFFQSPSASIWYSSANFVLMPNAGGSGNVGIGTTNPTYKLSVNGTIRAKEIRVESNWSDFVFEKKYVLPSLDNVARYISQHKHLPGIPSAREVKENGLPVAEMQTKMMAKIEELTLYVIEQNKRIARLEQQIYLRQKK